ncbi:MAG: PD-(D/E)XK nuclease family protein, partial [Pseudomonadota bacterium]
MGAYGAWKNMIILTNSSISSYMACPRRYWWAYELGIRRETEGRALTIGKAYHAALERLNRGESLGSAVAACRAADLDEVDRELAACMVAGWAWRWSEAPQFARILAVEQVFEFKPVRRVRWKAAGKIDVIGELADGRVAVGEYKT